jgi:trimeric autotransporter adhesin
VSTQVTALSGGNYNVVVGDEAGTAITTGDTRMLQLVVGMSALNANTTASYNTAVGYSALTANTTG